MTNLIYQVWPISWRKPQCRKEKAGSALQRITEFVPRISRLGVRYLWISPIYPSPWRDHGYDVQNFKAIDFRLGDMSDFRQLVKIADEYDIEIIMDLVLNHTSIYHPWFKHRPEYYCWSPSDKPGWQNIFDGGSCWRYNEDRKENYLHLFNKNQADLNWFPDGLSGEPNQELIKEFQDIVDYWVDEGVAGFRLDATQCINKDVTSDTFDPFATANEKMRPLAAKVINGIFDEERSDLFLLMECLDLSGDLLKYYFETTSVDAVMDNTPVNTLSITHDQSATKRSLSEYLSAVQRAYNSCPAGYAHVTESHDCPRFTSAAQVGSREAIDILFGIHDGKRFIHPRTIVVYQGQELGLKNPSKFELSDVEMTRLDAETKMRFNRGEALDDLRPTSRANARVAVPIKEYMMQELNQDSCLKYFIETMMKKA